MMASRARMVALHCVVQIGILLTLVWKWKYFLWSDEIHYALTLSSPFFPDFLESAAVVRYAFLGCIVAIVINIVSWNQFLCKVCNYTTLALLSILLIHEASYNDATFTTAWWACLWSIWYVHRMNDPDRNFTLWRGAFLSRVIISMILLGGAVGKWTPEYWNGDVFFDIYFVDRDYWVFNLLRENFEPETLRTIATWYSRKVILIESLCGMGLWLLPTKWAAAIGFVLLTSIALFSNFYLFSVMFALMGLALAGFFVVNETKPVLDLEA